MVSSGDMTLCDVNLCRSFERNVCFEPQHTNPHYLQQTGAAEQNLSFEVKASRISLAAYKTKSRYWLISLCISLRVHPHTHTHTHTHTPSSSALKREHPNEIHIYAFAVFLKRKTHRRRYFTALIFVSNTICVQSMNVLLVGIARTV